MAGWLVVEREAKQPPTGESCHDRVARAKAKQGEGGIAEPPQGVHMHDHKRTSVVMWPLGRSCLLAKIRMGTPANFSSCSRLPNSSAASDAKRRESALSIT